jgi:hypothetical protein
VGLLATLGAAGLLGLSAWLNPAGEGHGTHTQIGLPPCSWAAKLDAPCATCGMTTAFSHAANGDLITAAMTQPMGMLLALATAVTLWAGLYQALTGVRLDRLVARLVRRRAIILIGSIFLASWAFKYLTWTGFTL